MIFKIKHLLTFGVLTCLFLLTGTFLHPRFVHAAAGDTYQPGDNDVAIYCGTGVSPCHSKIDARISHFKIFADATIDTVTVKGICDVTTAGVAGAEASINGGTPKQWPGGCSGKDMVFKNVSPNSILTVTKTGGEGHQPFTVSASSGGSHYLTISQRADGNARQKDVYDWNSYGVGVWMGDPDPADNNKGKTFHMTVPCSVSPATRGYYIKWKDADLGQEPFQPGGISVFIQFSNPDWGSDDQPHPINPGDVEQNNEVGHAELKGDTGLGVYPGDHITVTWNGGDSNNAMQHILPFSNDPTVPRSCSPPVKGTCNASVSDATPNVGDTVTVTAKATNTGNAQWPAAVKWDGPGNNDANLAQLNPGETSNPYRNNYSRGSPVSETFVYHVMNGSDQLDSCSVTVTWGNPTSKNDPSGRCEIGDVNLYPYLGQSVTIPVKFYNTSTNSSGGDGKDWVVGDTSQHSGVMIKQGLDRSLFPRGVDPPNYNPPNVPWPLAGTGGEKLSVGAMSRRLFTVSNSSSTGDVQYMFTIRKDNTNSIFGDLCNVVIHWQSPATISAFSCTTTSISDPTGTQYYLIYKDSAGNVVHNTGYDAGWPKNTGMNIDTYNIYSIGFLAPHNAYTLELVRWGADNLLLDTKSIPKCMSASCSALSTDPTAIVEPGQSFKGSYGMTLTNNTTYTFPSGTYGVKFDTSPGLSGSGTDNAAFAAGGNTNFVGPYTVTANYTGTMSASLQYKGTNINSAFTGLPCSKSYTPQTRPYLEEKMGDLSAGGGFASTGADGSAVSCSLSDPNYIAPKGGNNYTGGILTFANTGTNASSADFAAFALGLIEGAADANGYGFLSTAANSSASATAWTFANTTAAGANPLGGNLVGTNTAQHCAPDYFHDTAKVANPTYEAVSDIKINPGGGGFGATSHDGQYYVKPTVPGGYVAIRNGAGQVGAGDQITIYVNGNVYISKDITYQNWGFNLSGKTNNIPYLTIIAKGNILVDPSVSQLDGLYIAQPNGTSGSGSFITCSLDGVHLAATNQVTNNCQSKLTVNGAVIAQHVDLLRSNNTLVNGAGHAAETFNFSPTIVLGEPNFKPNSGVVVPNSLDSLFALPPVF